MDKVIKRETIQTIKRYADTLSEDTAIMKTVKELEINVKRLRETVESEISTEREWFVGVYDEVPIESDIHKYRHFRLLGWMHYEEAKRELSLIADVVPAATHYVIPITPAEHDDFIQIISLQNVLRYMALVERGKDRPEIDIDLFNQFYENIKKTIDELRKKLEFNHPWEIIDTVY